MKTIQNYFTLFIVGSALLSAFHAHAQHPVWSVPTANSPSVVTPSIGISGTGGDALKIKADNTSQIQFYTGGTSNANTVQRMTIDPSGTIGIGGAPSAVYTLNVSGLSSIAGAANFHLDPYMDLQLAANKLSVKYHICANTYTTTDFYVKSGGNTYISSSLGVGVQPTSAYALDVAGATRISGDLSVAGNGTIRSLNIFNPNQTIDNGSIRLGSDANNWWFIGQSTNTKALNFYSYSPTKLVRSISLDYNTGRVNIGDWTPNLTSGTYGTDVNVKLAVAGTIVGKKIVCTSTGWADYVFEKDYALASLPEVEAFVKSNKHLPGIPTASELEEKGIDTAEMMRLQMMKIEELTLHLIQLQKEVNQLKSR